MDDETIALAFDQNRQFADEGHFVRQDLLSHRDSLHPLHGNGDGDGDGDGESAWPKCDIVQTS